jgi:hypothetical protein
MTNEEIAERLATEFDSCDVPEDILDMMVYDNAQEDTLGDLNETDDEDKQEEIISGSEARASDINNGGFEEQILYLLGVGISEENIRKEASRYSHYK